MYTYFTMQAYKLQKVTVVISHIFVYCLLIKLFTTIHVHYEQHGITRSTLAEKFSKIKQKKLLYLNI